ncbi:oligoendopeptidase F [Bacillus sp. NA_165.1]
MLLIAGGTMKHAGVDMSKSDAIRKAVSYVGSLIDKLEHSYQV